MQVFSHVVCLPGFVTGLTNSGGIHILREILSTSDAGRGYLIVQVVTNIAMYTADTLINENILPLLFGNSLLVARCLLEIIKILVHVFNYIKLENFETLSFLIPKFGNLTPISSPKELKGLTLICAKLISSNIKPLVADTVKHCVSQFFGLLLNKSFGWLCKSKS